MSAIDRVQKLLDLEEAPVDQPTRVVVSLHPDHAEQLERIAAALESISLSLRAVEKLMPMPE